MLQRIQKRMEQPQRQQHKNGKTAATTLVVAGVVTSAGLGAWNMTKPVMAAPTATAPNPTAPNATLPDSTAFIDSDANLPPLPIEYVPMKVVEQDRRLRAAFPKAVRDQAFMQPLMGGRALPPTMQSLPGAVPMPAPLGKASTVASAKMQTVTKKAPAKASAKASAKATAKSKAPQKTAQAAVKSTPGSIPLDNTLSGTLLAQGQRIPPRPPGAAPRIPQPTIAPFPVTTARTPKPTIPSWVRYPLEFQMCGIGIGTRAVDKDQFNRIDRYGLFAMHGNPTAVVVPTGEGGGVTITQTPPEVAALFPQDQDGGLPNWAAAITVGLDNNHVAWLYNRDTYAMSFIVDRLGFVDAIVVAGTYSPIAKTQLEDPLHTVQLGDDLRKVLFRYGYPDTLETYAVQAIAGAGAVTGGAGAGQGGEGSSSGSEGSGGRSSGSSGSSPGGGSSGSSSSSGSSGSSSSGSSSSEGGSSGGEGGGGGAGVAGNAGFRTFELRYEQSYNVVFTIRDNRVVRIYIFGDPDFFNMQRRRALRTSY